MVLTAALGTVAGGTMINSFTGSGSKASESFLLTVDPSSQTMAQGASAHSSISIISVNGYAGSVALSLFFPGAKLPALLSPSSVTVPAGGIVKSTLTITSSNSTSAGNYTIVVIGVSSSHGKPSYASSMLAVQIISDQDFTITSSPSIVLNPAGFTNTTNIVLSSVNSYSGTIALSVTVPFGYITVTGGQSPITLTPGGTASSMLQIITSSSTVLGTYNITVTGTSGPHTHTTTISLAVVAPNPPTIEALTLNSHTFNSSTNLTLFLQNTGSTNVTLQSYSVRDLSIEAWTLSSWAGPTITSSISPATILIGPSCNNCIYTGIVGLFTQFIPGHTYIVTVTTAQNNKFSFSLTY